MKKTVLQILLLHSLLFALPVFAQSVNQLAGTFNAKFAVLQDKGYSITQILKQKSSFKETNALPENKVYWIRLFVENSTSELQRYVIQAYPNKNTCLYTFNAKAETWISHCSNLQSGDKPWLFGKHSYQLDAKSNDTIYLKIDVSGANMTKSSFKAKLTFLPENEYFSKRQDIKSAWLVGCTVLLLFFFNNLSLYFGLKDRTVRNYLILQLGSIVYLTSYWFFFDFGDTHVFSYLVDNEFRFYDINKMLTHISILLIFYGLVQLTRSYLNTKEHLPLEDKLLKYALYIYVMVSVLLIGINSAGFYIDFYTLKYDNLYCALLLLCLIYISLKAYIVKIPLSKAYLLANLLPLVFMFCIPIYHLLASEKGNEHWLPVFGVISQALGFSIALLTRTRTLEHSLKNKEMQRQQLEFDIKEIAYLNKLNAMELVQINTEMSLEKNRNENLQQRLELHQRELASSALNMVQKTELLASVNEQIQKFNWLDRYHTKKNVEELNQLLQNNIQLAGEWEKFRLHFEQVHPNFFEDLKKQHPSLTPKEIRLHTYFEMRLSHKEIAALLDIDPASVRRAKTRLLKKMSQA